ncbi:MAG: hypothetical protein IJ689_07000 [Alphaproteobacteria bacterium]|nr:hypothetical protein [Alphaproteobacteria bacterium]
MKNYILMFGIAGIALGSYCAYAGNSATMTVTATIAHDVSLTNTGDINLGTITINPAYTGDTRWDYSSSGIIRYITQGAIVSAPDITIGSFTANIPNPEDCDPDFVGCGRFIIEGNNDDNYIEALFGGSDSSNGCGFSIEYSGDGNSFKVYPQDCYISDIPAVTTGTHSGTITITYSPR